MVIPLWAWHWLWARPQHQLSTRLDHWADYRLNHACDCLGTDFKYLYSHWFKWPVVSFPFRCCLRCSWAAPTLEKWLTSFPPWASSTSSSSPVCPSFSTSPRWSTGALCPHCPGDTCVDWQDCGWVRVHIHPEEEWGSWFPPCVSMNKAFWTNCSAKSNNYLKLLMINKFSITISKIYCLT